MHRVLLLVVLLLVGFLTFAGFSLRRVASADERLATDQEFPRRVDSKRLPNLVQLHPRVFVGGAPVGRGSADDLRRLGVKTIISVDSASPNLELSARSGARYIHLPIGYDEVTKQRAIELAKAMRQRKGNIYLHCHHGQHRAPSAAAVACVAAGMISPEQARKMLELAGTAARYRGLHRSVRNAHAMNVEMIDAYEVEFRERADVSPFATSMVEIEHALGIVAGQTRRPNEMSESPPTDLQTDPSHHAVLLEEHFAELIRMDDRKDRGQGFLDLLKESHLQAGRIRKAIEGPIQLSSVKLRSELQQLRDNCTQCHSRYRDRG